MKGFRILQVAIAAAGVVVFAWRYQSLRQSKAERERLEKTSVREPAARLHADVPTPSTNAGLSDMERHELLRLRGQIGVLRRDLAQETNPPAARGAGGPSGVME